MQAKFAKGNQRTVNKIISLRKEALADHQYRVATRLHAVRACGKITCQIVGCRV
jgi:hypothetical protein